MKILVINGPNINMLGIREKEIYGEKNFEWLQKRLVEVGKERNIVIEQFQSNIEGEIVSHIQKAYGVMDGIIINAGAYTHYSIAIMDAIKCVSLPTVEVHISNVNAREEYRQKSFIAPVSVGSICGFGLYGYEMAIDALMNHINEREKK